MSMMLLPLIAAMQAAPAARLSPPTDPSILLVGTYSNAEEVYFEREAGREPPASLAFRIEWNSAGSRLVALDEFGAPTGPALPFRYNMMGGGLRLTIGTCSADYRHDGTNWVAVGPMPGCAASSYLPTRYGRFGFEIAMGGDSRPVRFNRVRPFTCWVSVRRHADRANGEADWSFDRNLAIHDQGGRVLVQPEGAPPVVIRMRNVVWPPPSTNRPSLVLYVHRPESPDRAESYSWADPDARMVGINLRWVQASCTRT
jgi:hypothetical protein